MTVEEMTFANQYHQDLTEHFFNLALGHIPGTFDEAKVMPGPNLGQAVFVSIRQNCPILELTFLIQRDLAGTTPWTWWRGTST